MHYSSICSDKTVHEQRLMVLEYAVAQVSGSLSWSRTLPDSVRVTKINKPNAFCIMSAI